MAAQPPTNPLQPLNPQWRCHSELCEESNHFYLNTMFKEEGIEVMGYKLWVISYGLWVMGYGLWVMSYEFTVK